MLRSLLVLLALTACSAFTISAPSLAAAAPASTLARIEMGRGDKHTAKGMRADFTFPKHACALRHMWLAAYVSRLPPL